MANFKKSFSFRNGVQVDTDNFVVNPNGQVGIGSTTPTELFDLRGNAVVSGLTTTQELYAGIGTVGILTATRAGVTTLAVDTIEIDGLSIRTIVGYHTAGWNIDYAYGGPDDPSSYGAGSGISTTLKVGIGTTQAFGQYDLLVGGDPSLGILTGGVAINRGDIHAAGIITASEHFVGIGSLITQINASNIEYGTISDDRLPDSITSDLVGNVTGISTFARNLTGSPNIAVTNVTAGIVTAFRGNLSISSITQADITSSTTDTATVTGTLHLDGGKIGIGSASPSKDFDIRKSTTATSQIVADNGTSSLDIISLTGESRVSFGQSIGIGNSSAVIRFGQQSKAFDILNYDTGNIRMILDGGDVGVNTGNFSWHYNTPASTLMTLTGIGGSLGINNVNPSEKLSVGGGLTVTGEVYFDNILRTKSSVIAPTFIGDGSALTNIPAPLKFTAEEVLITGVTTSKEIHVFDSSTGIGSIGIGTDVIPTPHHQTSSRIESPSGLLNIGKVAISTDPNAHLDDNFNQTLRCGGFAQFTNIGIGTTTNDGYSIQSHDRSVYLSGNSSLIVDSGTVMFGGPVGLYPTLGGILLEQGSMIGYNVGDGSRSLLDMGSVGTATTYCPLILPTVSTGDRDTIKNRVSSGSTVAGSIIFNSSTSKFEGYNGTDWVELG